MDDPLALGNLIEAGLWLVIALILVGKALTVRGAIRRVLLVLAGAFVAFGISDVIESQTGAWWRPPWLLLLKGSCILVFLAGFRSYFRLAKGAPPEAEHCEPPAQRVE
jgi:hypothetical protein